MIPESICKILKETFQDAVSATVLEGSHPYALVTAESWPEVAEFLRDDPRMGFNLLRSISALDMLADDKLAAIYDMMAVPFAGAGSDLLTTTSEFAVRIEVDRRNPHIPSVASVWPTANWHEREAFDMMGIVFDGHPDLRRILCCEDWQGYPLRKDYVFPLEYHGIPGTTEYELNSPVR